MDNAFKWVFTILILGGAIASLVMLIYYKHFWESDEFLSELTRLRYIFGCIGTFGTCALLSYFVVELWDDSH